MSKSLHETGLPAWMFTPTMAVAGGIAFGVVVLMVGGIFSFIAGAFDRTDLNSAPQCFAITGPVTPGTKKMVVSDFEVGRYTGLHQQDIAKVLPLAAACLPEACPRADGNAYRSAVRTYLMQRSQAASQLYSRHGDVGLQHARWIYGEEEDRAIIIGLRQRYAAGLFELKSMDNGGHDYIAATRMLLFGRAQEFKPCVAG